MARGTKRLSAREVAGLNAPASTPMVTGSILSLGRMAQSAGDGGCFITAATAADERWAWVRRAKCHSQDARRLADDARRLVREGRDPIAERNSVAAAIPTFGNFADELVTDIEAGFRNAKHRAQWRMTLTEYAGPLRAKPVDKIDTDDVLSVLRPIWTAKNETASRLRGRIERVLDAAKAKGLRSGENPARWRGHLANLLPKRQKLQRGHHPAMPFEQVPAFVGRLRERQAISALALEFCVLTAARAGEVFEMTWREVDLEARSGPSRLLV